MKKIIVSLAMLGVSLMLGDKLDTVLADETVADSIKPTVIVHAFKANESHETEVMFVRTNCDINGKCTSTTDETVHLDANIIAKAFRPINEDEARLYFDDAWVVDTIVKVENGYLYKIDNGKLKNLQLSNNPPNLNKALMASILNTKYANIANREKDTFITTRAKEGVTIPSSTIQKFEDKLFAMEVSVGRIKSVENKTYYEKDSKGNVIRYNDIQVNVDAFATVTKGYREIKSLSQGFYRTKTFTNQYSFDYNQIVSDILDADGARYGILSLFQNELLLKMPEFYMSSAIKEVDGDIVRFKTQDNLQTRVNKYVEIVEQVNGRTNKKGEGIIIGYDDTNTEVLVTSGEMGEYDTAVLLPTHSYIHSFGVNYADTHYNINNTAIYNPDLAYTYTMGLKLGHMTNSALLSTTNLNFLIGLAAYEHTGSIKYYGYNYDFEYWMNYFGVGIERMLLSFRNDMKLFAGVEIYNQYYNLWSDSIRDTDGDRITLTLYNYPVVPYLSLTFEDYYIKAKQYYSLGYYRGTGDIRIKPNNDFAIEIGYSFWQY